MDCPHCAAPDPYELGRRTALGYRTFRCRACARTSNERTGTPFNHLEYPTDVVLLVVERRLQYTLSLRDLATMFLERGIAFTHEAVREWEARFAPLLAERLRAKRRGKAGRKWYVDETHHADRAPDWPRPQQDPTTPCNKRTGTPCNDLSVPTDVVVVTRQAAQQRSTPSSCQVSLTIP